MKVRLGKPFVPVVGVKIKSKPRSYRLAKGAFALGHRAGWDAAIEAAARCVKSPPSSENDWLLARNLRFLPYEPPKGER